MKELRDRPVFICGHPKSGTSLLRNLLDFHPQLVVYPEESRFFRHFLPLAKSTGPSALIELAHQHLIHIFEWRLQDPPAHQEGFPDRDYSWVDFPKVADKMAARLEQGGIRHLGDLLSAAILAFGDAAMPIDPEPRWWVEKTPYNEYYADQIFAWWPSARCIHVLRDPCDNFASYRRKQTNWRPEFFASNWLKSAAAGLQNQKKYGEERYWIMRYEDLAQQPEKVIPQVLDFLNIQDHPALRTPTRAGLNWQGNSMFNQTFEGISSTPVGRWQAELSLEQAALIQQITRKIARRFRYPSEAPKPPAVRLKAWVWQVRSAFYRLRHPADQRGEGL